MATYKNVQEALEDIDPEFAANFKQFQLERDAKRYRWLIRQMEFELSSYNGPDSLENATESNWQLISKPVFKSDSDKPLSISYSIDEAMNLENETEKESK